MNRLFKYFLVVLITISGQLSYAQNKELKESLIKINNMLKGMAEVSIKKENLVVKFTRNGELYRQDKVMIDELDAKMVEYVGEENAVVLRCSSDNEGCVFRNLFLKKRKNYYSRLNIILKGKEKVAVDLTKEFKIFLDLYQEN
ncbi:MAG: hypothetical protein COB85_09205 [Bacteroidetes bacterium]|nr:MAG: hypothetical protein COB85_09205 [Bacteroidota bacterium]